MSPEMASWNVYDTSIEQLSHWLHRLNILMTIPASAALLHDLSTMVARQLAEAIVTVDDGPVYDLSVSQNKVGVCHK